MSKQRLNNLFFFLGLAAVVVMLFTFDVSFVELWEHICHAGYWLIPIVGVWIIIYGINALSWREIILSEIRRYGGTGGRVSFLRIYRLTITGYALNYATPVGGLGGEPYRILELSKNISGQQAASSVILYAMMHFFAHFWFWFSSLFIYLGLAAVGDLPINTAIATVLSIIIVFCLIAFWIFSRGYRKGLVVGALRLIGRIPGLKGWSSRFLEKHSESLHNIDTQIASLYAEDKSAFYRSLLLEYLSRIVQSSEVFFMLLLFGIDCGGGFTGLSLTYLHAILNGDPVYCPIDANETQITAVKTACASAEKLTHAAMVRHEFVDGNIRRQRTTFSDGTVIDVDFDADTFAVHEA